MMKGMEFKLMLGALMLVAIAGILIFIAFDAKNALANIDKIAPWLHLGDSSSSGSSGGTGSSGEVGPIQPSNFAGYPSTWNSGGNNNPLSFSSSVKWASTNGDDASCKSAIENLFDPTKNTNFQKFVDRCRTYDKDKDFKSSDGNTFSLRQGCVIDASTLADYIREKCQSPYHSWDVPSFDFSKNTRWARKCGEIVSSTTYTGINYYCGIDNACSGDVMIYYGYRDKGIGICSTDDFPTLKDSANTESYVINWFKAMITLSKDKAACHTDQNDCILDINLPSGIDAASLAEKIRDMFFAEGFNENFQGVVYQDYRDQFTFSDRASGTSSPCKPIVYNPTRKKVVYNCGPDNSCQNEMRFHYSCSAGGGIDNKCVEVGPQRLAAICEKP